ncbi:MAG: hypothetical protein FWH18_01125 [Marinilabiliaceae bacterium]|nr:hypothetical protein [Marinilabiliaceae bacterium]
MTKKIIVFIATLLFCGVVAAQNQNEHEEFLNAQFLILEEVQPLTQAERDQMKSIFYEEIAESGIQDFAFNMAMSATLKDIEYYKHYYKDAIAKRAWVLYHEDLFFYEEEMELAESTLESVKPDLKELSEQLALVELYFFATPFDIYDIKADVRFRYEKNISDIYIRSDSKGTSYNLGLVLQNREQLNLSMQQIDAIVDAAQEIKTLSDDGSIDELSNNCWLFEREFIIDALSEEQVSEFVIIRYSDDAAKYAIETWKEGKAYQIEYGNDSIAVLDDLFYYQINKLIIQYIYYDDKEKMKEMLDFWYKEAYPQFLRQLVAERRRREAEEIDEKDYFKF